VFEFAKIFYFKVLLQALINVSMFFLVLKIPP
jgi:hypothetical protein